MTGARVGAARETTSASSPRVPVKRHTQLRVSRPTDPREREADRLAGRAAAIRGAGALAGRRGSGPSGVDGGPLPDPVRNWAAPIFGDGVHEVRVHDSAAAHDSADRLDARAFSVGRHVVFNRGEWAPWTTAGRRLLAHELAHATSSDAVASGTVHRDLKAYGRERIDVLPSAGMGGGSSWITHTAEAPGIRAALATLIADGKVKEVQSSSGDVSWFAAEHHRGVTLSMIRDALTAAGYALADRMARSIYDIHGEYVYSNREISTATLFGTSTHSLGERVSTVRNRSMTEWEIRQARRVFGSAINYADVTIADGSPSARIASAGGYARTIGNVINFPTGASRNMELMIHELTHVWQYQTTGWTYAPAALWAQVTEGYSYTDAGKTAEQSLLDARAAGKTLSDYNNEQQGDILADYFRRLRGGSPVTAWEPFVKDIPGR